MKHSYEDLLVIITEQRKTIAKLEKRIEELEERLNLNSNNISIPQVQIKKRIRRVQEGALLKAIEGIFANSTLRSIHALSLP